ncbi:MAG: heavy-metal-associated domain-containing protein [Candidatus Altiarchaeales archaeon]|nr:heavy-metal-associated domain-containing protein [Candidatus Altiarchaeales archaeon]
MRHIIKIPDLKCDGCITTVEQRLRGNEGINNVVGNLDDKEIMVDYNEKTISIDKIKKLIKEAGYTPGKAIDD